MKRGAATLLIALLLAAGCAVTPERRKEAAARMQMGVTYLDQRNLPSAMTELTKAKELDPENPEIDLVLGMAYSQRGDLPKAEEHLRDAISRKPDYAEAHNNLGIVLGLRGRGDEAIGEFEKAARSVVYPTPEYAYYNMGAEYRRQGKVGKAEEMYRKAIVLNDRYLPAWLGLAGALRDRGDLEGAIGALSRARDVAPEQASVGMELGAAFEKAGKREKALEAYRGVLAATDDPAVRKRAADRINALTGR